VTWRGGPPSCPMAATAEKPYGHVKPIHR
jgi:hypothetical protein